MSDIYKYYSLDHEFYLNSFQLICIKLKFTKNDLLELYSLFKESHHTILETLRNHKMDNIHNIQRKFYQDQKFMVNYIVHSFAKCSFCHLHLRSGPHFIFAWNFFEKPMLYVNQSCAPYLFATIQLAHISDIYLLLGNQFLHDITQCITRIMIIDCFQRHFI